MVRTFNNQLGIDNGQMDERTDRQTGTQLVAHIPLKHVLKITAKFIHIHHFRWQV